MNAQIHNTRRAVARTGLCSLMALFASVLPAGNEALAQVRPAYVKNVDEPGRTPLEMRTGILPGGGGCFTGPCANYVEGAQFAMFDLPAVPAGKRWVVLHASGGLTNGQSRTNNVELRNSRDALVFAGMKWTYGGPFANGTAFNSAVYSEELFAVFGPGEVPTVRVSALPNLSGYLVVVFTGYLIDATN
jgi:hypothetical protein